LIIALVLNYIAGSYVEKKTGGSVSDLILDSIPAINLSFIFYYGALILALITLIYVFFFKVHKIHIVVGQTSLLIMVRSFFICLTHISTPEGAILSHAPRIFDFFDFQNALFFSGHTAAPFLLFLIFRKEKIGIFFLIMTFVMAATVLLMHVHYSIDVFAALFISYGCYKIGNWMFSKVID
jgi:membrane-associated phospholipid phosphatase